MWHVAVVARHASVRSPCPAALSTRAAGWAAAAVSCDARQWRISSGGRGAGEEAWLTRGGGGGFGLRRYPNGSDAQVVTAERFRNTGEGGTTFMTAHTARLESTKGQG